MKKLVICVAVLAMVWTSSAMAVDVPLVNASFEEPFLAVENSKIKGFDGDRDGFMGSEFDVPGWEDDCASGSFNHSGIKQGSTTVLTGQRVRTGNQAAHLSPDSGVPAESIVWQLTDQTIAADEIYTLNIWGWSDGTYDSGSGGIGTDLKVSLFYDDAGSQIEVASQNHFLPFDINNQYPDAQACGAVFTVSDVPGSIGKKLGVKFENITASGFIHLDDASVDVIPEPATMVLLGLGSLALLKRRRA
ncbi:MAG: PEP-CTERM sorting domain-containing protein [Sedimentisphaerales bacterium]|nr:PEP-CTERM sorting domain-containing protein [Sedimentisphaerales bacterium]